MKRTRTERKAEMLHQAEGMIDELLEWDEQHPAPTLSEVEEAILKWRQRWGQSLAAGLIENQAARRPVPGPVCPQCQGELHYKGMKTTQVESRAGRLSLERGYYYCETCQAGFFPPR